MKCENVFTMIDELYPAYLKLWETVCNMESPTMDKARVDAVGQFFLDIAKKKGWETEVFESVTGNVPCITMNPDAEKAAITLSAHMDTVHPVGSMGTPAVKEDEANFYGPGVTDCKGGLVVALLTMDALDRLGYKDRPVRFLLQSDEEAGSRPINKATIGYMCEKSKGSRAFFNLEGAFPGKACVQRKGIATYLVKVHGIEAHSSACAKMGASAIAEAAHKLLLLEEFKDHEGITCTCGVIRGGTAHNTVPGYCEFRANFRFATVAQQKEVVAFMQALAEKTYIEGCRTEVEEYGFRPPMERVERNLALLDELNRAFEENGLSALEPITDLGGSDAAQITTAGIPCLDNFGVRGGYVHSPKEFAVKESLREAAKRLCVAVLCL